MKLRNREDLLGDRYRVGEALGSGAMAEVRAAVDERLERDVAIKRLRPELADDPDLRLRFEAEARAAAALTHPNIVAVFDVDSEGERPYIVMERLPGRTLADEKLPMDPGQVLQVAEQLLAALHTAHRAGIIHRDVKPSNVLRAADGTWKVADFGIAKSTEARDVTTTGVLCTPAYVAPERLEGKPATPPSDLFSVGVVLYELLAGARPFVADTPLGVAEVVRQGKPQPLLEYGVDPRLAGVVHRALERDPRKRFKDAAEMADALAAARDPSPHPEPASPADTVRIKQPKTTRTRTLDKLPEPEPEPRERGWDGRGLVFGLVAVALLALLIAIAGMSGGNDPGPGQGDFTTESTQPVAPTTVTPVAPEGPTLPTALENALENLERSVQR